MRVRFLTMNDVAAHNQHNQFDVIPHCCHLDPLRRNSMFSIPEQFSNATKTQFEAQLAMMTALTNKAFESVEKIVDLNMSAVKASLEESTAAAKQILTAKDQQEL